MILNLTGGATRTVNVNFVGNNGLKWITGDLNFDGMLTEADWLLFIAESQKNLSGLSVAQAYQKGDLNSDGLNSIADFALFKSAYDAVNGSGAFVQMLAGVPEPGTFFLLGAAAVTLSAVGRRRPASARRTVRSQDQRNSSINPSFGARSMSPMAKRFSSVLVFAALVAGSTVHAAILEDFPFSDANDTPLDSAANVVNPSNSWILSGNSLDPSAVLNGNYRITKSSAALASAHIDIANVTTGKVWLVAEIAGWNYTSTPSGTSEEVRLAFLDNDNSPPSGSTITAQMDIRRSGAGLALVGRGALGTGASDVSGEFPLPLSRNTPFTMALELDKNADQYTVYYKDNLNPFLPLGTGNLGTSTLNPGDRDGNSIRFATTGAFNDTNEFFDINRIYLTNTTPIVGPVEPVALTLKVLSNGQVSILNDTDAPISFDSYRIGSISGALNFAGWNSLSDQNITPFDGPDPGTTPGDGVGETWDEAGGSSDFVLAESFLLSSTSLAVNDSLPLGSAFKPAGQHDLTFEYRDPVSGAVVVGTVDYAVAAGLTGDYNNNNVVDAADYILWREALVSQTPLANDPLGLPINQNQYNQWRANFGSTPPGSGSNSDVAAVPEPAALVLLVVASVAMFIRRSGRRS